ncbi:MAG: hypothetical protein ACKVOU_07180 [Cytophagales bacterium]
MKKTIAILLFYFLPFLVVEAQVEDLFSKQNSLKYAQYLIDNQDYNLAASEYSRLLKLEPDNDSLRLKTIILFKISNQIDSAFFYINGFEFKHLAFEREYANLNLISENWKTLEEFVKTSSFTENEKQMLVLHTLMWQGKWKKAQKQLENVAIEGMEKIFAYNRLVEEGIKSPHRNMALALAMSAMVPGLGKVYAGAPLEGLSTFVITGFLAFSAYRGFIQKEELSIPGWIFGAGFVGFYVGNIYGTVKQVKKFNEKYKSKLKSNVKTLVMGDF